MNTASNVSVAQRHYRVAAVMTSIAGALVAISWFFPWVTMYFTGSSTSSPLVETPYTLATTDPTAQAAWIPFFISLVLIGFGIWLLFQPFSLWLVMLHIVLTINLLFFTLALLGTMAVTPFYPGSYGPGVVVLKQLGFVPLVVGELLLLFSVGYLFRAARARR